MHYAEYNKSVFICQEYSLTIRNKVILLSRSRYFLPRVSEKFQVRLKVLCFLPFFRLLFQREKCIINLQRLWEKRRKGMAGYG